MSIFIVQTGDKSQSNPPRCFDPNTERPWQNSTACKGHYHQAFNSVIISYLSFNPSVNQTIFLPFPKFEELLFLSGHYVFFSLVFVEHFFFLLLWNNFFPPQIMKTSVISGAPIGILRTCRLFHWRPPVTQVNTADLISTQLSLTIIDQLHSKCDLHNDQYCPSFVNL